MSQAQTSFVSEGTINVQELFKRLSEEDPLHELEAEALQNPSLSGEESATYTHQSVTQTTLSDQEAFAYYLQQRASGQLAVLDHSRAKSSVVVKPLDLTSILKKREDEQKGKPVYSVSPIKNSSSKNLKSTGFSHKQSIQALKPPAKTKSVT